MFDCSYVEFNGLKMLYDLYRKESSRSKYRILSRSYFCALWQKQMRRGVTDPTTGTHFNTYIRTIKARGFSKCDRCEFLKHKIRCAKTSNARRTYSAKLESHYNIVKADREELARIARCDSNRFDFINQ